MSKPPPKPAKPGKSNYVTFCVFYSGLKPDVFLLRATHLVADVGLMGGELLYVEVKLRGAQSNGSVKLK